MKKSIIAICFLFTIFYANSQDTIYWTASNKLNWNNFKSKPDSLSEHGAVSNIHIKYSYTYSGQQLSFKNYCFFYTKKSWSKIFTSDALAHEQGHFDIGEIFARKFRKNITLYKLNATTIKEDIKKIAAQINMEKAAMDNLYDTETDFHRNDINQTKWNKKIGTELFILNKYAN